MFESRKTVWRFYAAQQLVVADVATGGKKSCNFWFDGVLDKIAIVE